MVVLNAVLTSFQMISDTGARAFIIRDDDGEELEVVNTVRTIMIVRGLIIAALIAGFAPQIAGLMGKPELTSAFLVMALVPAFEGCISMRVHLVTRARRQRVNEMFELAVFAFTALLSFVLALWLRNYWAFVYAAIATAAVKFVCTEIFYERVPYRFTLNTAVLRRMWSFSSYVFLASIFALVANQTDKVIVGSRMPLDIAGVYGMAMSLTMIFTNLANNFARRVFFADAAASVREKGKVPEAYYGNLQKLRFLLFFICGGCLTFGVTFFDLFFDDRYALAGQIFAVSAIGSIIRIYASPAQAFLVATGYSKAALIASILKLCHIVIFAPLLFGLYGLMGLVVAVATVEVWAVLFLYFKLMRFGVFSLKEEGYGWVVIAIGAATGFVGSVVVRFFMNLWGL